MKRASTLIATVMVLAALAGCGVSTTTPTATVAETTGATTATTTAAATVTTPTTTAATTTIVAPVVPKTEQEAVNYLVETIKTGNYEDAWFYTTDFTSKECKTLNTYAYVLMLNKQRDYYFRNLSIEISLDPNYSGKLAKEIKEFALQYADVGKNYRGDAAYIVSESKTKAEINARSYPKIGMTTKEAYNSTWGYPDDIKKISTKYSETEQWIYGLKSGNFDLKFLYFENGILTAIQK